MPSARILVADDDAGCRLLLRDVLTPLGHEMCEAADGQEALEAVAAKPPDLLLVDAVMPRVDGYAVCRRLKKNARTRLIPIVMLTGLSDLSDKLRAIDAGVDDFLTKPVNIAELTTRVRSLLLLKKFTDELEDATRVMQGLALTLERRDAYTGNHGKRLGDYSVRVGRALGLPPEDLEVLRVGSIFHDLGKIAVPDSVLRKPSRLGAEEFEVMKTHPAVGADLCAPMRTLDRIIPLIRHHHEKLDGSGYPDGLAGSDIPVTVRIVSVADVYDALATARPYKKSLPRGKCFEILRREAAAGWWDREVVETLIHVLADDPVDQSASNDCAPEARER